MKKEYTFGKWTFKTQKDLESVIKKKIKELPRNQEIVDEFLLTFLTKYHEEISKRNLTIKKLKILDWEGQTGEWEWCRNKFRGGVFVMGYFEPVNKWHGITLYPHKRDKPVQKLVRALRQKWAERLDADSKYELCEECGAKYPEIHHDNITFKEIAGKCMGHFSQEELANGINDDWWEHEVESDALADDHPAVLKMLELHTLVKYKWLCKFCHQVTHKI